MTMTEEEYKKYKDLDFVRVDGIKSKISFAEEGVSTEELFEDMLFNM